jgi:hypothetical protein
MILRLIVVSLLSLPLLKLKGACLVVSDAPVMLTTDQSATDGGQDGNDNSAKVSMQKKMEAL